VEPTRTVSAPEQTRALDVAGQSVGELFGEVASESARLVRDEVALARQEIRDKLNSMRGVVVALTIAAFTGNAALLVLCAAVCAALSPAVGLWQGILIVSIAMAVISGAACAVGMRKLKRTNLKPEKTMQTLEENKKWLKELT